MPSASKSSFVLCGKLVVDVTNEGAISDHVVLTQTAKEVRFVWEFVRGRMLKKSGGKPI